MAEPSRNLLLYYPTQGPHPNDFSSVEQLCDTLQAFITRYNTNATPSNWKYTAADLERHLARIPPAPAAAPTKALPEAA